MSTRRELIETGIGALLGAFLGFKVVKILFPPKRKAIFPDLPRDQFIDHTGRVKRYTLFTLPKHYVPFFIEIKTTKVQ